jgi:serine/threonine protein kinase
MLDCAEGKTPMPPSHDEGPSGLPPLGTVVGNRYRLTDKVGHGSMSVVFRSEDMEGGEPVAVRFLRPERANPRAQERFKREAAFAMRVSHPNIPAVYDVGQWRQLSYMVMRLIRGRDLKAILDERGPLDAQVVVTTMIQVSEALQEAHLAKVIHRDLKSPNILRENNHAWVIDFGIARSLQEPRLTATGIAVGTPAYMAPEVARGIQEIDGRADIYSLGVTMFEVLAGELPFYDNDPLRLLEMHVREPIPDLMRLRRGLPESLVEVVECCMAKRPEDRFRDAAQLGMALDAALRDLLHTVPRPRAEPEESGFVVCAIEDVEQAQRVASIVQGAGVNVRVVENGYQAADLLEQPEARFALVSQDRMGQLSTPKVEGAPLFVIGGAGQLDGHRHVADELSLQEIEALVNRFVRARGSGMEP